MVENTSIISKTDTGEPHSRVLLGGQTSQRTHNGTAVQGQSPSTGLICLVALGSVVHLESTSPTFPMPYCGVQAEMTHFKSILLTLLFLYFTINTSSQPSSHQPHSDSMVFINQRTSLTEIQRVTPRKLKLTINHVSRGVGSGPHSFKHPERLTTGPVPPC